MMTLFEGWEFRLAAAICVAAVSVPAAAQEAAMFPSRAITLVVPYPLSGPSDIRGSERMTKTYKLIATSGPPALSDVLARIVQQAIRYESRYPVVLTRQPGPTTARGAQYVARSPADGHTLLLGSNATLVLTPSFVPQAGYDPRDFEAVAPLAEMPFVLMASARLPCPTLNELIACIRARPGAINYASSGDGSTGHLAGELFKRAMTLDMVHVSYNGGLDALNAVAAGQTSLMFAALPLALPYLSNARLRPLALAAARRSPRVPALPTLAEAGVPGVEAAAWYGVFAPRGTPTGAVRWLNDHIGEAVAEPATGRELELLGLTAWREPLPRFASRVIDEGERFGPLLRRARIAPRRGA